ncbi:MAG: glycoside hydrolase family 16 protein [Gammaproteobacteria bacterium]
MAGVAHATYPVYADGDLAPLGAPDGLINTADYLIASRIALDLISPTDLERSHGDLYPVGAPDGVINLQDLLLLQQRLFAPSANQYVENLDLFVDGPAVLSATVNGTTATTTATVGGYIGPGATVINNPNYTDPADSSNTVWYFSSSGGVANVFLGTADLGSHGLLDSGFDLSGAGLGQLVFDIQVNSLSAGATLTVKIDSGYPNLGQVALAPSQYTIGSWRRVAINFADLLANPGPGAGLDLGNVVNAFVLEVTNGSADFYLDNIFISHACPVVNGCQATVRTKGPPTGGYQSPLSYPGYTLVWNDEFSGTALNLANWSYETGTGNGGWGNQELQYYRSQNTSVANGLLTIEARQENFGGRNYTSSRLKTQGKQTFRYGKIDIRAALPRGQGLWPALWMLGKNFPTVGWPASGEIDIMEMIGGSGNEGTIYGTAHWDNAGSNAAYGGNTSLASGTFADEFHVFSIEWDSTSIRWLLDGVQYHVLSITDPSLSEFQQEFFFIFNVAVGGTWPGSPDGSTYFPQRMLVDYVRVFQKL